MSKINKLVTQIGYEKACQILEEHYADLSTSEDTLTIVVNRGVHHMPEEYAIGELYFASDGNLDFSSKGKRSLRAWKGTIQRSKKTEKQKVAASIFGSIWSQHAKYANQAISL